eukprot:symbB.v1.2.040921.t1/scaffold7504.1/size10863/1
MRTQTDGLGLHVGGSQIQVLLSNSKLAALISSAMKTFHISWEEDSTLSRFEMSVPSGAAAADLSCCVRDRLGLKVTDPFYVTWEKGDGLAADNSELRLVLPLGRSCERPADSSRGTFDTAMPMVRPPQVLQQALLDPSDPPGDAASDPKALATDLANERTLLAWLRTGLAAIRTVFSFATLSGLTAGELAVDVGVTLVLSFSGLATLLLGWKRFLAVRSGCP